MPKRCFLIIPDASFRPSSGGTVNQKIVSLLKELGDRVIVFGSDIKKPMNVEEVRYIPAPHFTGWANLSSSTYLKAFQKVCDEYHPTHVFFNGSITNKPLCYLEEAFRRNLKVILFVFMQDFFCSKYYANDTDGPCRRCLDYGLGYVFRSTCGVKNNGLLKLAERYRLRVKLRKLLSKVDYIGTSTDEQIQFYVDFGIPRERTFKLPLPFEDTKIKGIVSSRGDYFVGIAQNRIEKGFQFIPSILQHTHAKVVLAYYNETAVNKNIENPMFKPFVESGQLKLVASSWDTGLGELIANSQGVIIPSIWPTTTEYGWLEAMALRKPTVAFDISAHHEFMKNRRNGLISPIGDFAAMGANMDYLSSISDVEYNEFVGNVSKLYERLNDVSGWRQFLKEI